MEMERVVFLCTGAGARARGILGKEAIGTCIPKLELYNFAVG